MDDHDRAADGQYTVSANTSADSSTIGFTLDRAETTIAVASLMH